MQPPSQTVRLQFQRPWRVAAALVAGGLLSIVPMAFIIEAFEGGRSDPTGIDGDLYGTIPMALLGAASCWLLRRRETPLAFAAGWTLLQTCFTATFSEHDGLVALLLPLAWATLLLDLQAPIRLVLVLPVMMLFALSADIVSSWSTAWAAASGMLAALGGAVYFVGWGLRERTRWGSHVAWSLAAIWSAMAFILALADLFEYLDPVAVIGAFTTLGLLSFVGFAWVGTRGRLASARPT